jgi:acetyl-CoA carboxylase biotin carboxyl carrier protein
VLTFDQIKELIDLVWERKLQSVEIERSGFRLKIDGRTPPASSSTPAAALDTQPAAAVAADSTVDSGAAVAEKAAEQTAEDAAESEGLNLLRSPIVGTFYTSPAPDADPYVRVGDVIKKGQVLCIVEAMKLMNEIEADEDGVIEKVFPKNAQPVEYGEPLFAVRPD